jgi:PAS domain S-box-containing protein
LKKIQEKQAFRSDSVAHWISLAAGGAVLLLGLLVLGGWMLDIMIPMWPALRWTGMIPITALCFVLLGGALCLQQGKTLRRWKNCIARVLAGATILIGILTFVEYTSGISLGIHELLFEIPPEDIKGSTKGMAVTTALSFVTLGLALLILRTGRLWLVRTLITTTALCSYLALLERIFRGETSYELGRITSMPWHTSVAFLILCFGVVTASKDAGVLSLATGKHTNVFVRRLIPASLFVPLIIAWVRLYGQRQGLYGTEFGIVLVVMGNTIIFIALILWSAQTVHKINASREATETEFEHERFLLLSLMKHATDRIYFKDAQSRFLRVNPPHLKLFGLTEQSQVIGKNDFDFFSEEHAQRAFEDEQRVMETGKSITMEEKETWPDGNTTWVLTSKFPLHDPLGRVIGTFGISHDITARKNAEDELKLMSDRLILATRSAAIGIWDFDPVNNQLLWDDQMFEIFRVNPDQFSGNYEAWQATVHPDDLQQELTKIQMVLQGEEEFDSEFRIVWPDQSIRYIKVNAMVQRDTAGKAVRMIGTNWDITARKNAEQKLAQTMAELAHSNADLEQFASVASHDLQEPLRAVSGCVELLAKDCKDKLDDDSVVLMQHILDGTKRMQTLIRDLLEYSRVNIKGKPLEPTDTSAALDVALANLTSILSERDVVITRDPLPIVLADSTQLTRIFQNLIVNGVKFCGAQQPKIHIGAEYKKGCWIFSVRDNGIGIEPQYRERIFVLFQRLHTRSEYTGTGIGLAICKRIVERHNGKIWLESDLGKGSTFFFTLSDPSQQLS